MIQALKPISEAIPVMESFQTLQGEGKFSGHAAYFIRLAGCDVGCVWCDVKASWEQDISQYRDYPEIAEWLDNAKGKIVVVTGGEPCIYPLETLTQLIADKGFRRHLETSGAYPISGDWEWITLSPKKFKAALPEAFEKCHELKVVIFHKSDLEWAQELAAKIPADRSVQLLIQPEWSKKDKLMPLIIDFIQNNPTWSLSLQTHKYIGIE